MDGISHADAVAAVLGDVDGHSTLAVALPTVGGPDAQSQRDILFRVSRDSRILGVVEGSFGTSTTWHAEFTLRWLDFSFAGNRRVRVFHATRNSDLLVRAVPFEDPDRGGYGEFEPVLFAW